MTIAAKNADGTGTEIEETDTVANDNLRKIRILFLGYKKIDKAVQLKLIEDLD